MSANGRYMITKVKFLIANIRYIVTIAQFIVNPQKYHYAIARHIVALIKIIIANASSRYIFYICNYR